MKKETISFKELLSTYFSMGYRAFGGWSTTYLLLEKAFITNRHTISQNQLKAAAASGQTLPGPAQVILVAQIAYYMRGVKGAVFATIAYLTPSILITILFGLLYFNYFADKNLAEYTLGLQAAVGGIIIGNAYRIGKSHVEANYLWLIAAASTLICFVVQPPAILVIIGFGILGLAYNFARKQGSRG